MTRGPSGSSSSPCVGSPCVVCPLRRRLRAPRHRRLGVLPEEPPARLLRLEFAHALGPPRPRVRVLALRVSSEERAALVRVHRVPVAARRALDVEVPGARGGGLGRVGEHAPVRGAAPAFDPLAAVRVDAVGERGVGAPRRVDEGGGAAERSSGVPRREGRAPLCAPSPSPSVGCELAGVAPGTTSSPPPRESAGREAGGGSGGSERVRRTRGTGGGRGEG